MRFSSTPHRHHHRHATAAAHNASTISPSPSPVSATLVSPALPANHADAHRATWKQLVAGIAAIAAAYIYFLIFAEFAFLRFASEHVAASRMTTLIATLGVAGIFGSFAGAALFKHERARSRLVIGFAACLVGAFIALAVRSELSALLASVTSGAAIGWTTVTLTLCLRPTLHRPRLGLWCGVGTGLAYAICNLPPVFNATPADQIIVAAVAAVIGLVSTKWIHCPPSRGSASPDYKPVGFTLWVALFLLLVFLDSLVFYLIHQSPLLRQPEWADSVVLLGNAFVHLATAILAGVALDRGWPGYTVFASLVLLVMATYLFNTSVQGLPTARVLYVTGVSVYSTTLIWFAARGMRRWKTAILFSVSGWTGSALAIGAAMKNPTISFLVASSFVVLGLALAIFLMRYVFAGKYVR